MEEEKYIVPMLNMSYNFLWPLVGFIKNTPFKPERTYLYSDILHESIEDYNLLTYYRTNYDSKSKSFEKGEILKNEKLISCYNLEGGMCYIFDLISEAETVFQFLEGKYSQFPKGSKDILMKYFSIHDSKRAVTQEPIYEAIYPEYFFEAVSKELGVKEEYLRSVGELARKYDKDEETMKYKIVKNCECKAVEQLTIDLK